MTRLCVKLMAESSKLCTYVFKGEADMSTSIKTSHYTALVREITLLYNEARHALVESYWQIGRRIVEQEQWGDDKAVYGK